MKEAPFWPCGGLLVGVLVGVVMGGGTYVKVPGYVAVFVEEEDAAHEAGGEEVGVAVFGYRVEVRIFVGIGLAGAGS